MQDFLWQKRSYFPNNYLHFGKFKEEVDFEIEAEMFAEVLSSSENEQQFQKHIKENRKWFIPGSIQLMYEMQNLKIVSFDRLVDNIYKLEGYNSW